MSSVLDHRDDADIGILDGRKTDEPGVVAYFIGQVLGLDHLPFHGDELRGPGLSPDLDPG